MSEQERIPRYQFHGTALKDKRLTDVNVQVRPADGTQTSDELNAAADTRTAIRAWEMPENQQAKANPYPVKRQSERSMRYQRDYADVYVDHARMAARDRGERQRQLAQERREARAAYNVPTYQYAPGVVQVRNDGTVWQADDKGKLQLVKAEKEHAERKPRVSKPRKPKMTEAEREDMIARLAPYANPRPFRSEKNRIGRAS